MLFIENECYEIFWEGFFILCLELLLVDGLFVVIWIDFVFGCMYKLMKIFKLSIVYLLKWDV